MTLEELRDRKAILRNEIMIAVNQAVDNFQKDTTVNVTGVSLTFDHYHTDDGRHHITVVSDASITLTEI